MKKSNLLLLLTLLLIAILPNSLFASNDPIPGIDVIVKKRPGDIVMKPTQTTKEGQFSLVLDAGEFNLSVLYDEVLTSLKKNNPQVFNSDYYIVFTINELPKGVMAGGKSNTQKIVINKDWKGIIFSVAQNKTSISGELTVETIYPKANNSYQSAKSNSAGLANLSGILDAKLILSSETIKMSGITDNSGDCRTGALGSGTYFLKIENIKATQITCIITIYPVNEKIGYMLMFEGNAALFANGISFKIPENCRAADFGIQEPGVR